MRIPRRLWEKAYWADSCNLPDLIYSSIFFFFSFSKRDGCVYVQASENLHWVEMYTDSLNGTNVVEIVKEKGSGNKGYGTSFTI